MYNFLRKKKLIILLSVFLVTFSTIIIRSPDIITVFNPKKLVPIYCVERDDKKISISFDASWGNSDTENLLKILKKNKVKATFFVCGYWIDKYSNLVKKIVKEGHDIGNHGNTHAHGSELSIYENKQEILKAHEKIKKVTGDDCFLFRPPYGEYNDDVIKAARELNYYPIQWSIDSLDWKNLGVDNMIDKVLNSKKLDSGAIILFHNDTKYTPQALDVIIKSLKEKQYELVKISELIYNNYNIDMHGMQLKENKDISNKIK
ncbi:MAG: polysaccharide deacetylase family protein [Clostridiales bacterium]|jgi:polysaccharide deacetylase family sporulation protein PdaB|nr:polysaccharide deacetylase family protein [Clostridiales bacterium]